MFKKIIYTWNCLIVFAFISLALTTFAAEADKEQKIITRVTANIFDKEHYRHHPLNDEMSEQLFYEYFKILDPAHIYFTQEDIKTFENYKLELDNMLLDGDATFAFEVYSCLLKRIEEYRKDAELILKNKLDFSIDEYYTIDRSKEKWPVDSKERQELWRLKIKNDILVFHLMEKAEKEAVEEERRKNSKDDAIKAVKEPLVKWNKATPEERAIKRINSNIRYLKENDRMDVLELYLSALASVYDPHSAYMSPKTVEDFNIQMKLSLVGIGATLALDDGYTKIIDIVPGGPADLDGRLKPEDRIIAVAHDDAETVDVIDMPLSNVVNLIRGKKDTIVRLAIIKGDKGINAIPEVISIKRDTVKLTEQEAKGEIRKIKMDDGTERKIGILTLPSFYFDFEGAASGLENYKNSTDDVKKILGDFNKEKVDGLLLDIRSNGGGSLFEAISLTGLFIKHGPVVQVRTQDGSVEVDNDPDGRISYDGPLVVLVNRLSASAAEILAGAIQDYGRGIIIGDNHTYGKGTVQTVCDLDNFLRRFGMDNPSGSVNITTAKFYRINGESTQDKGVRPDIIFPSYTDCMEIGEEYLDHTLPWDTIKPVKFESFGNIKKNIPVLSEKSLKRRQNEAGFKILSTNIERFSKMKEKKFISLNEDKRWGLYKEEEKISEQQCALLKLENANPDNFFREEKDEYDALKGKKDKKQPDLFLDEAAMILCDYIEIHPAKGNPEVLAKFAFSSDSYLTALGGIISTVPILMGF